MKTRWACAFGVIAVLGAAAVHAQEPARAALWTEPPAVKQPIRQTRGSLQFAAQGQTKDVALAEFETASMSESGGRVLVFDRQANSGRVFDAAGSVIATVVTEQPFAGAVVSNSGLVALTGPITREPELEQEVRLFGGDGRELWRIEKRFLRPGFCARFSGDGELLAVLSQERAAGDNFRTEGVLFGAEGQRHAVMLPAGYKPGDVAFGHTGHRIALGVHRQTGDEFDNRIFVWEPQAGSLLEIACADLGQLLVEGSLQFAPDDSRIVVNGLGKVQMYDVATAARVWSTELNAPNRAADLLADAVKVAWQGNRIVVAHSINAQEGKVKYAVSVLNPSGLMVSSQVVGSAQRRGSDLGQFWGPAREGRGLEIYLDTAPVVIELR